MESGRGLHATYKVSRSGSSNQALRTHSQNADCSRNPSHRLSRRTAAARTNDSMDRVSERTTRKGCRFKSSIGPYQGWSCHRLLVGQPTFRARGIRLGPPVRPFHYPPPGLHCIESLPLSLNLLGKDAKDCQSFIEQSLAAIVIAYGMNIDVDKKANFILSLNNVSVSGSRSLLTT